MLECELPSRPSHSRLRLVEHQVRAGFGAQLPGEAEIFGGGAAAVVFGLHGLHEDRRGLSRHGLFQGAHVAERDLPDFGDERAEQRTITPLRKREGETSLSVETAVNGHQLFAPRVAARQLAGDVHRLAA